jgi:FkbM family methyltransferase
MVRSFTRSVVPRKIYILLSSSLDWSCALWRLGWKQSHKLWKINRHIGSGHKTGVMAITPPNLLGPFFLRPGTSDVNEFVYTIVRETYGRHLPNGEVKFILDAGANMGDTAAWLLTRYPGARLIAVEPDPENFVSLLLNSEPYGERLIPVQAAVWPKSARLSFRSNTAKDAVQVEDTGSGDCLGVTIPELMTRYDFPRLDIFKCDIEGGEKGLFSLDADQWLLRSNFVVVEVHSAECLSAVLQATSRHQFTHREFRNLHIFERPMGSSM